MDITFAPVMDFSVVRMMMAIAANKRIQGASNGCEDCILEW
jgi:hypothetical protein